MSKSINELHTPVALNYALEILGPSLAGRSAVMVDGTLGLGGHAEAFLEKFDQLTVVGIDRDTKALELAAKRLERFAGRVIFAHAIYSEIGEVIATVGAIAAATARGDREGHVHTGDWIVIRITHEHAWRSPHRRADRRILTIACAQPSCPSCSCGSKR